MNRFISSLFVFIFMFSLVVYGQSAPANPLTPSKSSIVSNEKQLSKEVLKAISYGFVPKEIQNHLETPITFSQYCSMLSKMIAVYDKSLVLDFEKTAHLALTSNDAMNREDGILAAYYAALAMKMGNVESTDFSNGNWMEIHKLCGEAAWDSFLV